MTDKAKNLRNRNRILLSTTAIPYYSLFKNDPDLIKVAIKYPHLFNVQHILELTVAEQSQCTFIDGYGQDLDNVKKTDVKTASLGPGNTNNCMACTIHKVGDKVGSIAAIISNPEKEDTDFFHISKKDKDKMVTKDGNLKVNYTIDTDYYNKLDKYRFFDFKDFCNSIKD